MPNLETFRLSFDRAVGSLKVVITMPAYNAEATLERTVADIPPGIADQLILVDDASPDNTAALARELGIDVHVHPRNRGYGGNQKTCYTMALRDHADIVVMLHPDYQYEPKAVPLLIAPILAGDADMTFGSRFAGLGDPLQGGMPLARYIGNRATTILENLMLGSRFSEMHSGMRAYTRQCLLSLPFLRYRDDFVFDSQLLIDAVTSGQRVVEVPIPTRYTAESSSIGALHSLSYVGRSLRYCAQRVWSHGRRRHRSPVGRRPGGRRTTSGNPAGINVAQLEASLAQMQGYFVGGNRLVAVGTLPPRAHDIATAEGWELRDAESLFARGLDTDGHVNAVLVIDRDGALDSAGGLEGLRTVMEREALLVLPVPVSTPPSGRPEALAETLRESGFRLVEFTAASGPGAHAGLAIARRTD
jgi:hypothetical protein